MMEVVPASFAATAAMKGLTAEDPVTYVVPGRSAQGAADAVRATAIAARGKRAAATLAGSLRFIMKSPFSLGLDEASSRGHGYSRSMSIRCHGPNAARSRPRTESGYLTEP